MNKTSTYNSFKRLYLKNILIEFEHPHFIINFDKNNLKNVQIKRKINNLSIDEIIEEAEEEYNDF